MRLHQLQLTAFGPFTETTEIDFDALSEAQVFLFAGPTGSGKSSVLDAVCFALYGVLAGDRSAHKQVRSQHAAPEVAPRVVLELTVAGRLLRVTRSPAWERPKKRGTGYTTQQASVLVEECREGAWQLLTSRIDEAGDLLNSLIGLTGAQFTQVVLLPQGRFQDFLRADPNARLRLLEQLFGTRRFQDVERWLAERRRVLDRTQSRTRDRVGSLAHRVSEVAGSQVPHDGELGADAIADLRSWIETDHLRLQSAQEQARHASEQATEAAGVAEVELARATELDRLQREHADAVQALDEIDAEQDQVRRIVDELALAEAAARVRPVVASAQREHKLLRDAITAAAQALLATDETLEIDGVEGLLAHVDRVAVAEQHGADLVARKRARMADQQEYDELCRDERTGQAREREIQAALADARQRAADHPEAIGRARERVERLQRTSARAEVLTLRHAQAAARHQAATDVVRLAPALAQAEHDLSESIDEHQRARELLLQLQERRISGMAGEMAHRLAVGTSCPVCGSCEHPQPAALLPGAPDRSEEQAARSAVDDADLARTTAQHREHALRLKLEAARTAAEGLDEAGASAALAAVAAELDEATRAGEQLSAAEGELASCAEQQATLDACVDGLAAELTDLTTAATHRRERIGTLESLLAGERGDHPDLASAIDAAEHALACHRTAGRALAALALRHEQDERAQQAQHDALREAEFADTTAFEEALRSDPQITGLREQIRAHDDRRAAALAVRRDPERVAAAQRPRPPLDDLRTTEAGARSRAEECRGTAERTATACTRHSQLATELGELLDLWQPQAEAHRLTADLAAFVDGRATDNREQTRLSAWVLAWRLGEVVVAANHRLDAMTAGRFQLEHSHQRGRHDNRGGLSLTVHDAWTGQSREPLSLSGGETFMVSLSLALGLTDVVTQEAGGADLGLLFVDEGFGALDPETLDEVMDTLDRLRSGGRVVGVVSHVPELAARIPTQLRVSKSPSGSTARIHQSG